MNLWIPLCRHCGERDKFKKDLDDAIKENGFLDEKIKKHEEAEKTSVPINTK